MNKTKIDWCDSTWNPVTGCLHGCKYCYARDIAKRFGGWDYAPGMLRANIAEDKTYIYPMEDYYGKVVEIQNGVIIADINDAFIIGDRKAAYPFGFAPTFHRYKLDEYKNKSGRNIFVCSMADLFGEWVPDEWIEEVFKACGAAPQHNYLFLTKNPDRYINLDFAEKLPREGNMWYGMSVTNKVVTFTAESTLQDLPAEAHAFISVEPLLEDVMTESMEIVLGNFTDWVIIGAETGRRKDRVIPRREWIKNIVDQCKKYDVPVFMKSSLASIWGEPLIQEFPEGLRRQKG